MMASILFSSFCIALCFKTFIASAVASPDFLVPTASPDIDLGTSLLRRGGLVTPSIAGWSFLGCYNDNVQSRTLGSLKYTNNTGMTDEVCTSYCALNKYSYAGTEYMQECFCANSIGSSGTVAAAGSCNMACSGNSTEQCGGPSLLTVYHSQATYMGPYTDPGPPQWPFAGCYVDNTGARTLVNKVTTPGGAGALTVALCTAACQAAGYTIAGVEYSQECYCGTALSNGGAPAPDGLTGCSMTCSGNATEYCGGPNRLNVYSLNGFLSASTITSATSTTSATSNTSATKLITTSTTAATSTTSTTSISTTTKSTTVSNLSTTSTTSVSTTTKSTIVSNLSTSNPTTSTTSSSSAPSLPAGWTALGCYTDTVGARTLGQAMAVAGGAAKMTEEACAASCQAAGYTLAGVEYADECYCDNQLRNGGGPAPDGNAGCNMACAGNDKEICGGPNRLTMYGLPSNPSGASTTSKTTTMASLPATTTTASVTPTQSSVAPGWSALGCYTDSVNARTLAHAGNIPGGPGAMTQEACLSVCQAAGYTLAGVEYSNECYCDNTLKNGGGPAPDGNAGCTMTCNGNTAEICGGPNRLTMFSYGSTGSQISSTQATPTTTSPSKIPVASNLPAGWTYHGCYVDNTAGRILTYENPDNTALTIESCVQTCIGLNNYTVAGLEYSVQCFCGDYLVNGATLASADTQCNAACGGNANEKCGDGNRMSIYATGPLISYAPPTAATTDLPGEWQYQGCAMDGNTRVFPYQLILTNNNSAASCLNSCSDFGYTAAGMEFGNQCWCGDVSDYVNAGYGLAPPGDCSQICTGNVTEICGGANRLSYYTWPALTTFNYASGNAAGQYQFLIGGVVVPLMTAAAVNGKVTFLEKSGTGPPNSTGAYELDLAQLGNFTAAWRPMHVKTDIFCSAGLTLPDKVGRQLTIGGWSGDSTYGVRLYWPDGSPGVWGTHDWQENVNEVSLQIGRWYPSVMMLSNGSVLVAGGESGSNGPPVPYLEVLPKPIGGGLVYADYLDRTDPSNLYPFLIQLPSGNIFIGYYNEARVLDGVSFNTVKELPNLPGAVNNFLAGRTYPLEGTAVVLPQYAPYTDPLTVLVCGGSTPYQGIALDNCVSTQPDVANPQWVLERMPSKRVLVCMTALPDGTYLILNGAHQGYGGFGLANDPNLNAILYNPLGPVHNRFTLMANTTVDRLYHSEAILLDDGRVLVSGSDPENNPPIYPQEYRVEVFIPPYLMGSPVRPTFTLASRDWVYGQPVGLTITSGSTVGLKVSLMGAVTSTHGNSMGQRTFFPAVSCTGTACQITPPPNARVCPPSWFQVFVMVNGVPGIAQWVRIGGDPAGLGNWPNFPDFNVPGLGPVNPSTIQ